MKQVFKHLQHYKYYICIVLAFLCSNTIVASDRYFQLQGKNGKTIEAEILDAPTTDSLRLRTRNGHFFTILIQNIQSPNLQELASHIGKVGFARFEGKSGYSKDWKLARNLLKCAFEMGDTNASYAYGLIESQYGSKVTAFYAFRKAATQGHPDAQNALGECFLDGEGVRRNPQKALHWFLRSENGGNAWACFNLAKLMVRFQKEALFVEYIARAAERFATNGDRDGLALAAQLADDVGYPKLATTILTMKVADISQTPSNGNGVMSGTAWFFSPTLLVTCHHVIANAARFTLWDIVQKREIPLEIVETNPEYDLAILKISPTSTFKAMTFLPISTKSPRLGESIFVLGFPLPTLQGQNIKYTDGTISALSGYGDTSTRIQHSAPTQPGNSGGPLLNRKGEVIGVVDSGLDKTLASDVNYAVKTPLLIQIIRRNGHPFSTVASIPEEDVISHCQKAVYQIFAYPAKD